MFRRIVPALTLGVLVLSVTPGTQSPALASRQPRASAAGQPRLAALAQSYFVALNHGLATGNFSGLRTILSPRAMLTERSTLTLIAPDPQISTIGGRSAIIRFYRQLTTGNAGSHWIVGAMNQVSPTTMVVYAHMPVALGGHPLYSSQRMTVRNGTITTLELSLYALR